MPKINIGRSGKAGEVAEASDNDREDEDEDEGEDEDEDVVEPQAAAIR